MSFLAAAASDEGGITGFLLDLVDTLGPVGVGLASWPRRSSRRSPARRCSGWPGVLINDGPMDFVPVVLFATLGSVLGAIFFYYIGRALGPRRSHAFLDRLPLVETEDVDKTFDWFERHGRVGGVLRPDGADRAQLHLGAGRRRPHAVRPVPALHRRRQPDLEQRAHRRWAWLAGDFVEDNLHYLDYVVVAVVVLVVGVVRLQEGERPAAPPADGRRASCRPTSATRHDAAGRPAVVALDVNETLLDLAPVRAALVEAGQPESLLATVFARTLLTGFAATVVGTWCRFRDAFDAALAQESGLPADAAAGVPTPSPSSAPHPDVEPALRRLTEAGVRVVTLSHGSPGVAEAGLARGGIAPLVEATLTSESIRALEALREVYLWAAGVLRRRPGADGAGRRARLGRARRAAGRADRGLVPAQRAGVPGGLRARPHVAPPTSPGRSRRCWRCPPHERATSTPRSARPGCSAPDEPASARHAGARPRRRWRGGVGRPGRRRRRGAADAGWRVLRVEQPWRVAGKRIAPAPPRLDEAWGAVLDRLRADGRLHGPLVLGGRSAGARVACRTAAA